MDIRIEVDGEAATLAQIDNAIAEIVTVAALNIEALAKERAPVDTGALRGSIQIEIERRRASVTVGAEYGVYVEGGTVHQAAQPFMAPAVAEVEAALPRVAEAIVQREVRGGRR